MKARIKCVIAVFIICFLLLPTVLVVASKEVNELQGIGEDIFINLMEATIQGTDKKLPYIGGYEDKTFRADELVTREEMATMLARLLTNDNVPEQVNTVPDLILQRYSTNSINYITKLGLMSTYSDGSFKIKSPITWTEFNNILQKVITYIDEEKSIKTKVTGDVSRAEAIMALNEVFDRNCVQQEIQNPYIDLKPDHPAYRAILCASVVYTP